TAVKMRAVAGGRGRAVVLANGTEGEPASYKDKLLLCHQPHLVADGALLAAAAVGAGRVVIGVEETAGEALGALRRALAERGPSRAPGWWRSRSGWASGRSSSGPWRLGAPPRRSSGASSAPGYPPRASGWVDPPGRLGLPDRPQRGHPAGVDDPGQGGGGQLP